MALIKIALVDDHPLFRKGICNVLSSDPTFMVSFEAKSGDELLQKMNRQKVDIVIADISMPEMDGVTLTKIIVRDFKGTAVIGFSVHDQHWYIRDMLEAGARGYVVKTAEPPEVIACVKEVYAGKPYFCQEASRSLARKYLDSGRGHLPPNLTDREVKLLHLLIVEKSDVEIMAALDVSVKTLANEKRSIMEKTGVKSLLGLGRWVVDQSLV